MNEILNNIIGNIIGNPLSCVLSGYLIGGIPFGYILVKLKKGIDIRTLGSGNIGATNVGRVLGWPWGVLCFLLDAIKGCAPTVFVFSQSLGIYGDFVPWGMTIDGVMHGCMDIDYFCINITYSIYAGLGLIMGHLFPVYLRFRGGKGVATALGVFLVIAPYPTIIAVGIWILSLIISQYVSLSSIIASVSLVTSSILLSDFKKRPLEWSYQYYSWVVGFCIIVAILVVLKHVPNIKRLIKGTESKVKLWGKKPQINTDEHR